MVDSYTLDKINNYVQQKNDGKKPNILQIQPWLDDNKFVTELKPNAPHDTVDRLKTAIKLYSTRNIPHLAFTPTILIKDDIKEIVDYLVLVPPFLKSLYNKMDIAKCGPPFTVDVSFAVKSVEMVIKNEEDEKVDVDDEDDDDFDNAYGHQNEEKEKEKEDPDKDHIGDLRERLGDNLLSYSAEDPEKKEDELYSLAAIRRILTNGYNGLRTELSEKTNDKERFDDVSYPRFKRFGIFIDRRAKKDDEMAKDDVSFYEVCNVCCLDVISYMTLPLCINP